MVLDDRFNTHINLIPKTQTKGSINNYSPLIFWIESLGMSVTPIGPELHSTGKASPSASLPKPEQRRQIAEASVAGQFEKIILAAQGWAELFVVMNMANHPDSGVLC
jgi:N-acyl-D-aspartate/D-glutamate deacylase